MIPFSEIERIIAELEDLKATDPKYHHPWNSGWNSATNAAQERLRELLPK